MEIFDIVLAIIIIICGVLYILNRKHCNVEVEGTCIENERKLPGKKDRSEKIAKFTYRYKDKRYSEWSMDAIGKNGIQYEVGKKYSIMINPKKPVEIRTYKVIDKLSICLMVAMLLLIIWFVYDLLL